MIYIVAISLPPWATIVLSFWTIYVVIYHCITIEYNTPVEFIYLRERERVKESEREGWRAPSINRGRTTIARSRWAMLAEILPLDWRGVPWFTHVHYLRAVFSVYSKGKVKPPVLNLKTEDFNSNPIAQVDNLFFTILKRKHNSLYNNVDHLITITGATNRSMINLSVKL